MYFLNYIYFLIITLLGAKLLFQKQGKAKHPFHKGRYLIFDGPEMFWILTFSTGLLALSAPGTLDLMAIRLMILEVFCITGIFIAKKKVVWNVSTLLYFLYLLWLLIGVSYTDDPIYGLRVILKFLYPFLIMLFASAVVRNEEVFIKAGLSARVVALISIVLASIPFIEQLVPGVFWYGTARAINYIPMCIFSLALYYYGGKERKDLLLCILFILPCLIWVFRTSIIGTTLALMIFFFFKYKMKSIPAILGILLLLLLVVFTIPSIKDKMFNKADNVNVSQLRSGEITADDINSNARFGMWEHLMNKMYDGKEIIGSGTGSVQNYMYNNFIFGGLKAPHNDYVQIICDNGIIGVVFYLTTVISILLHCFREYNTKKNALYVRVCAIIAAASIAGVCLTMYTDNVVNYSMATLSYPFGFYGMMLGLKQQ